MRAAAVDAAARTSAGPVTSSGWTSGMATMTTRCSMTRRRIARHTRGSKDALRTDPAVAPPSAKIRHMKVRRRMYRSVEGYVTTPAGWPARLAEPAWAPERYGFRDFQAQCDAVLM